MEKGGNMKKVFERFCDGANLLEKVVADEDNEFMFNKHKGYIHTCPSDLGTGLCASVIIKLPLLSQHARFKEILSCLRLQARGTGMCAHHKTHHLMYAHS